MIRPLPARRKVIVSCSPSARKKARWSSQGTWRWADRNSRSIRWIPARRSSEMGRRSTSCCSSASIPQSSPMRRGRSRRTAWWRTRRSARTKDVPSRCGKRKRGRSSALAMVLSSTHWIAPASLMGLRLGGSPCCRSSWSTASSPWPVGSRVELEANAREKADLRRATVVQTDRRRMTVKTSGTLVALAAVLGFAVLPATAAAQGGYSPVTDERLVKPEAENWLQIRGNYQGWSYSPLSQINAENVKRLIPVWTFSTGVDSGHEAPPLVNNGMMFIATPYSQVLALDAKTGRLLWRYRRELPEDFKALHNTSRGIALYGDKVYVATLDCYLVALDAKTGKQLWQQKVEDYKNGYYITLAPVGAKGRGMVGVSGGEFGVRGFVQSFDPSTGNPGWRAYTVPGPGEPGHDTWSGETWKRGGASVWMTGTYDPDLGLTYWGTGNGSPWFGDQRPGDNLYTSSSVAIDPLTGNLRGHFQYHWNESWDWDEMDAPLVVDFQKGGRTVKGLVHAARNGYLYLLERSKDKIGFVSATPYVKQNVFKSIDPKTGRPEYNSDRIPRTGKRADFCPSLWGGKDWPNTAYNPKTGRLFIPANDNHCGFMEGKVQQFVAGQWWTGIDIPDIGFTADKG